MTKETQVKTLYSKLYHKYSKLKKEKDSILEKLNEEQERKFVECVKASDELIDLLRSENDILRKEVNELRRDMSTIRHNYKRPGMHPVSNTFDGRKSKE
ncbi:OLC1v1002197C1 [Oldenlandia corymbosa var. corymbosa]|uniref:OLC1v1002197C1 n=1 Tax=Oldenlandia corymbosa var. corymbosa TaxID=529605 RepID=A0AAV1D8P4_OLDCO|nr:OLC1v1002197C1 [Oldenlandia corymbosa var. corymbosa]